MLVSMLVTVIAAPAMTAPLGSVTVPTIAPAVVWAPRGDREANRHSNTERTQSRCMTPSNAVDCIANQDTNAVIQFRRLYPRMGLFSYKLLRKARKFPSGIRCGVG